MGETCESCRSWADDIFWTHFKFIHFAQLLPTGFDQHLALPKRFSDNLRKKLPDYVTLKGPGGAIWSIRLTTRDNTLHFTQGWQQFAKDHRLEENDLLVFKYNGESQFDVLIFDRESFCEKAASYFLGRSGHTNKRNGDNCLDEVNIPSNVDVECASPEKSVHGDSKKNCNAAVECASPEQTKRKGRPERSNARRGGVNWIPDTEPASAGRNRTYEILYASNRRLITENEKENALQLAQAACTVDSFYIVMRPTHVNKKFYVKIPIKWMIEHFTPQSEDVILRMGENEWLARYSVERGGRAGGLTGGWKHFVLDNKLQEFDVCVFKPSGKVSKPLIMEVKIFRVNEEFGKVHSEGDQGRKRITKAIRT